MPLEIAPSLKASLKLISNSGSRDLPHDLHIVESSEFFSPQDPQI